MSKRAKILISTVVAVVLLTAGGAATVIAQDEPAPETVPTLETGSEGLLARVAAILGISRDELVSAFEQAGQEMRDEAIDGALARAVEQGLIDETEAAAIKAWLAQKPEALDNSWLRRARISRLFRNWQMMRFAR